MSEKRQSDLVRDMLGYLHWLQIKPDAGVHWNPHDSLKKRIEDLDRILDWREEQVKDARRERDKYEAVRAETVSVYKAWQEEFKERLTTRGTLAGIAIIIILIQAVVITALTVAAKP